MHAALTANCGQRCDCQLLINGNRKLSHYLNSRSVDDLPFCVANLDLAQVQLLHCLFDLCAVADRKNDHLLRQDIFLRHGLRLLDGHGVDALG